MRVHALFDDEFFSVARCHHLTIGDLKVIQDEVNQRRLVILRALEAVTEDGPEAETLEERAWKLGKQIYWTNSRIAFLKMKKKGKTKRQDKEPRVRTFYEMFFQLANRRIPRALIAEMCDEVAQGLGEE